MSTNPFLNDQDFYKRNIDPLGHYIQQSAIYLSKQTGDSIENCTSWLTTQLKQRKLPGMQNPIVEHYKRNDVGDRHVTTTPLSVYISDVVKEDLVLAPTFTTYINPRKKQSMLVGFIERNVKIRSIAKKAAFKAKSDKQMDLFIMKNNEQTNMKTYNNSLSGAFATKGSVLYNPTAHSTLTSTTRSVSSFGNASNERLVMGNRNYFNPDIITYAILATCSLIDRNDIVATMELYQLKYPTVDDVMTCITYSSDFYWVDGIALAKIRSLVEKLTSVERAAFMYSGDLYHLRQLNDGFIRDMITQLSRKCSDVIDNPVAVAGTIDEQVMNYAHQICFQEVKGYGKKYEEMPAINTLVATALNIMRVVELYRPFIKTFFLSKIMPESHANLPRIIRRSVVLSDTDSTCFSVDDWLVWYFGKGNIFNDRSDAVGGAVAFITTQSISHLLALLSANINVPRDKLHSLAMKNEYLWHVHLPTNVAKHYAALTVMQEGNVFDKPEMEIKGVHLKNSASPKDLIAEAHGMMRDILTTVASNGKIELLKYLRIVRDVEQSIIRSLDSGSVVYLKQSKIKEPEAYTKEEAESPYQHYRMWTEAWSYKYGNIEPPPFSVVKIPTIMDNKTQLKLWLEKISDRVLSENIGKWLVKHKKEALNTIYLSLPYVQAYGIPDEVKVVMDKRKVVLDLTLVYRIILESLGFYIKEEWLISDYRFV